MSESSQSWWLPGQQPASFAVWQGVWQRCTALLDPVHVVRKTNSRHSLAQVLLWGRDASCMCWPRPGMPAESTHLSLLACLLSGRPSGCLAAASRLPPAMCAVPPASPRLAPSSTAAAVMPKSPRSVVGEASPRGEADGETSRGMCNLLPRGRRFRWGAGRPPSESLSDVSLSLWPWTSGTSSPAASSRRGVRRCKGSEVQAPKHVPREGGGGSKGRAG